MSVDVVITYVDTQLARRCSLRVSPGVARCRSIGINDAAYTCRCDYVCCYVVLADNAYGLILVLRVVGGGGGGL